MKASLNEYFSGKSVSLLGAGISNMPLAQLLAPICKRLTVRDKKSLEELGENGARLRDLGAELITGEDYLCGMDEDIIFRSPGIRPDIQPLNEARERGAVVTSEMEMFLALHPCPMYAVTGSDGKSTTTTITSLLLEPEGKVVLGGNIGEPLLYRYGEITENDAVAVELSSFQLMTVDAHIDVAAITNITPNHLNWHSDMEEYIEAKERILKNTDRAVLNYDNGITREIAVRLQQTETPVTFFSLSPLPEGILRDIDSAVWLEDGAIFSHFPGEGRTEIMKRGDIKLPGLHNTANYITAIALTHGCTSAERIRNVARTFGGVEHRLEFVRELDGVTYINGSIDSSPTRTAAALSAINDRPVVLIAGGYDKNIPYEPLAEAIFSSSVHTVVLTGDTGEKIYSAIVSHKDYASRENSLRIIRNGDFDGAVRDARAAAGQGDTVILSPASASFDRFPNFEVRGRRFKDIVNGFQ